MQLPPDIQKQLDEYLTVNVDPTIRKKIEQNSVVLGAEHSLQTGADALHTGGQYVQSQYERVATAAHAAGNAMGPINPVASLAGTVAGEAAHLHGQAANAMGNLAADGLHTAKQAIEHGMHDAAQTVNAAIHSTAIQAGTIHLVNGAVDTYRAVENASYAVGQTYDRAKQAVSHGIDVAEHTATEAYDSTRQAASHVFDAVEHAAGKAYDTLTHPGQWSGRGSTPSSAAQPQHGRANPIAESPYTRDDPRHGANPNHALYQELHERIPAASEKRLLQFTAACHAGGITHGNIGPIAYDENRGIMHFTTASELRPPVAVDVKTPSPDPQHSIRQIQQAGRQQAHLHSQLQGLGAQIGQ